MQDLIKALKYKIFELRKEKVWRTFINKTVLADPWGIYISSHLNSVFYLLIAPKQPKLEAEYVCKDDFVELYIRNVWKIRKIMINCYLKFAV